jgi:hypothetical protein
MNRTNLHRTATLVLIVFLGLFLRVRELGRVGLNEDEVNKDNAAHAYLNGNFLVNLEHPMLTKSLAALSLAAACFWNHLAEGRHPIPEEIALRLPNVIFGSLTAIVLFLIAQELFGFEVGLLSAFLWAIGTIAIMVNREVKEDTLLVFFTWLAYYFYLRAKKFSAERPASAQKFYAASGGSFGLMLASKYFPHYLGLNFLYYWLLPKKEKFPPLTWQEKLMLFGACAAVFLLVDPVVLLPSTLKYMLHYAREGTMTHHGYLMMGRFNYDDPAHLNGGMPIYFYPLLLMLKTPIPILVALAIGLIQVFRRWQEPGPFFLIVMFMLWIVPFSLLSAKWLRWMLSWMPAVYIIAAVGVARAWDWLRALSQRTASRRLVPAFAAALMVAFLGEPLWAAAKAAPFYTLYLNPLGFGRTAFYFPHDEMNDMGLRPAISEICRQAPYRATVGGESEAVFAYYFHKFGRDDLRYVEISNRLLDSTEALPSYVVLQNGREYLENISLVRRLQAGARPAWTVSIEGVPAAQVYHSEELASLEESR